MGGCIVIVGFMGAGKSTVGRLLADRLGFDFVDTDRLVVERAKRSIPDLFRLEGEAGFRRREAEIVAELANAERTVIATGGGAPIAAENQVALQAAGPIVHLDVDADSVRTRTRFNKQSRPLLANSPREIAALLSERRAIYAGIADVTIDTRGKTAETIADEIVEALR